MMEQAQAERSCRSSRSASDRGASALCTTIAVTSSESSAEVDPPGARRHAPRVTFIVVASLFAVGAVIATIGAVLPRQWRVRASVSVNAPPAAVHAVLAEHHEIGFETTSIGEFHRADAIPADDRRGLGRHFEVQTLVGQRLLQCFGDFR